MPEPSSGGRRNRLRAQTTAEILATATRRLAADGAGALSLRAVARDLDMGVSSIYRYFPSRDDLLTALLVAAFTAQADDVETAAREQTDPVTAIRAALHAYRDWALAHPAEFALAYGTPVPGYAAPPERTIPAAVRVGDLLVNCLAQAWHADRIDHTQVDSRAASLSASERSGLEALMTRRGYHLPIGLLSLTTDLFISIHGFVVMEVFGQLRPLTTDALTAYGRTIDDALAHVGLHSTPAPP